MPLEQLLLRADRRIASHFGARVLAVRAEQPRARVVTQVQLEVLEDPRTRVGVEDRERHLHAPEKIAFHPVCAGTVELRFATIGEVERTWMLEKPSDDRTHADVLGNCGDARTQRAGT